MAVKTGIRKQSEELRAASIVAESFEGLNSGLEFMSLLNMVKRVKTALGLNGTDINVLEVLFLHSQKQDWLNGSRPIVWPSNDLLAERTGRSIDTVKRSLSRLIKKVIISPKDSANGKRFGHRYGALNTGIKEAYGFDLSPSATRYEYLCDLDDRLNATYQAFKDAKRQITIARKTIRMTILAALDAGLKGDWQEYDYDAKIKPSNYNRAIKVLESLNILKDEVLAQYDKEVIKVKMHSKGCKNTPHIDYTTDLSFSKCNENVSKRNCSNEQYSKDLKIANRDLIGMQKKDRRVFKAVQEETDSKPIKMSDALFKKACPKFCHWMVDDSVKSFENTAELITGQLGINVDAWQKAVENMGRAQASIAIAIIYENEEDIVSPGGYLRGMTRKAVEGKLNLMGSLIGLVQ